jgi:methylated-DNA-[protein]-cysteine S-methyltransferase
VKLALDEMETPIGRLGIVLDADGAVVALDWMDHEGRMRAMLEKRGAAAIDRRSAGDIGGRLQRYFAGEIEVLDDVQVSLAGTPFQLRVWEALRNVRPGRTTSYGLLATALGQPTAARAVGLANSQNPVSIIVPCHRVIGSGGALTGYAGGLARKRWLLDHEARHSVHTERDRSAPTSVQPAFRFG